MTRIMPHPEWARRNQFHIAENRALAEGRSLRGGPSYKGVAAFHMVMQAAIMSASDAGSMRTNAVCDRAAKSLNDCPNDHAVALSTSIDRS